METVTIELSKYIDDRMTYEQTIAELMEKNQKLANSFHLVASKSSTRYFTKDKEFADVIKGQMDEMKEQYELLLSDYLEMDGRVDDMSDEQVSPHYDNTHGSLYKIADDLKLNSWEATILKYLTRCRSKGEWESDIDKMHNVLNLYKEEQGYLYTNQKEPRNGVS